MQDRLSGRKITSDGWRRQLARSILHTLVLLPCSTPFCIPVYQSSYYIYTFVVTQRLPSVCAFPCPTEFCICTVRFRLTLLSGLCARSLALTCCTLSTLLFATSSYFTFYCSVSLRAPIYLHEGATTHVSAGGSIQRCFACLNGIVGLVSAFSK